MGEEESRLGYLNKRLLVSRLTVGLLSGDLLNVNAPLLSVAGNNLAFSAFEGSTHDFDCVTLADGNSTDLILGF